MQTNTATRIYAYDQDFANEDRLSAAGACAIRATACTPEDAIQARRSGASGIGLCRTERMFLSHDRIPFVRELILATAEAERHYALSRLLPGQQADFEDLFRAISPLPVAIRLLDPALYEFLPAIDEIDEQLAYARREEDWEQCVQLQKLRSRMKTLRETNPVMGHRGCRLSLTCPEILAMQVRAILQAAATVAKEGASALPEILVPLVATEREMGEVARMIHETAALVQAELAAEGFMERLRYRVGALIEVPRVAMCAGTLAPHVDFVSFGTNDLTQMAFGYSRNDCGPYLGSCLERGILRKDPFLSIDTEGVGQLIAHAVGSLRAAKPSIEIGVCGDHGSDPESIQFFQSLGIDYVSCAPSRIPAAMAAVAHSTRSL